MARIGKKTERKILIYISAAIITFLAFSGSLFLVLVNRGFYDKSFQEYGAYAKIGVEGIRNTADAIIGYLAGDTADANKVSGLNPLTSKEKSHMEDVHSIFSKVKYLSFITLALLGIILLRMRANGTFREDIRKVLKYSGIKTLIALAAVFFLSINFDWFFTRFHYLFFPQGNWQFPSDSLLIIMFPQQFFQDYVSRMFIQILIFGVVFLAAGILLEKISQRPAPEKGGKSRKKSQ